MVNIELVLMSIFIFVMMYFVYRDDKERLYQDIIMFSILTIGVFSSKLLPWYMQTTIIGGLLIYKKITSTESGLFYGCVFFSVFMLIGDFLMIIP